MKIWYSYGSEHSMNLVMIGQFETSEDAKKVHKLIEDLTSGLEGKIEIGKSGDRYSDEVMDLLRRLNCWNLAPQELEQFLYDVNVNVDAETIVITTEESEVSAFLKLMVLRGAKVETFSAHDYPDSKFGRGK
jgi:Family of unknown function (DUF6375)